MEGTGSDGASAQNIKDTIYDSEIINTTTATRSASETVQNHPATQTMRESLSNGPVADTIKDQKSKTAAEVQNLRASRTAPEQEASTGQPLTHYHSFFYNLLSWENPRVTAISFFVVLSFIFACRYLPALKWTFKALYLILGATAAAEVVGKLVLSQGLASSFRPKRYYTIPQETLESSVEDVTQLINFFVIEFQRVLFAENVTVTAAAFVAAFISYWLIKIVPFWGLSLIGVSCIYLGPLIYIQNKELIDEHLANAQVVVNEQASQVKDLANQHTSRAQETVKQYAGDYSAMAQDYIGQARNRFQGSTTAGTKNGVTEKDFPKAPKAQPARTSKAQPIPAH